MVDFVKIRHQNKPLLSSAQKAGIAHALGCSKTRSGTEKKSFDIYYRFNRVKPSSNELPFQASVNVGFFTQLFSH